MEGCITSELRVSISRDEGLAMKGILGGAMGDEQDEKSVPGLWTKCTDDFMTARTISLRLWAVR